MFFKQLTSNKRQKSHRKFELLRLTTGEKIITLRRNKLQAIESNRSSYIFQTINFQLKAKESSEVRAVASYNWEKNNNFKDERASSYRK